MKVVGFPSVPLPELSLDHSGPARCSGCKPDCQTAQRRFPPPWRADKMPGGYIVRDATGQAIA
jgi:hypothetical protein